MKLLQLVSLTTLTLAFTACSTFPIRTESKAISKIDPTLCTQAIGGDRKQCGKQAIYQLQPKQDSDSASTRMYILEINDQGLIVNPETAEAALDYLRQDMGQTKDKPVVSLFVHGWNNNAQADNADLINFEQAVMALNASQQGDAKSNVVGVYVSWRGKTMPAGLSHALTFWGRKAVSEEVGRGQLANFIFELETVIKPKTKVDDPENGKLILSGHSFGASALYNAVGHELMSRFYSSLQAQKNDAKQEIRGVGDIVILLNPAIQALRFNGLRETVYEKAIESQRKQKDIFANNKAPILMMVATEDDLPVETAFPIGRTISHLLSHNARDEISVYSGIEGETINTSIKQAERNSIGFYQPYYTHFLLLADQIQATPESNLYRVVNATQQILNAPKKVLETPQIVLQTPKALLDASIGVLETPKKIFEEVTQQEQPQSALTIGDCLSDDVRREFKNGRTEIDWLAESAGQGEQFSTATATNWSANKIDLLKLKITNHPQSLNPSIIEKWPLIQSYQNNQVLSWAHNPYWFVKAKANVMQGHNGIWNKNVACLLLSVMATQPVTFAFMQENDQLESKQIEEENEQLNIVDSTEIAASEAVITETVTSTVIE